MLVVVVRQKGLPAALSRRADRSTSSVKYVIKVKRAIAKRMDGGGGGNNRTSI